VDILPADVLERIEVVLVENADEVIPRVLLAGE
jgi:hypothetical protein